MRKFNSTIKTAFVSEAGRKLVNNDDFGFVELDKFACYVIADGIEDTKEDKSAGRLAIYSAIREFTSHPSMSKKKVKACLQAANKALFAEKSEVRLKASVTVILTDYTKMRYGQAGNTRLQVYRDGKLILKSTDQSMSQDMIKTGDLIPEKLAAHEERNNLYCYAGMGKGFRPHIAPCFKFINGDLLVLYTRGIWENVDEGELTDVFSETAKEIEEPVNLVEEVLLSKQPASLENYTLAVIAVEKVFRDPNRKRRIKMAIIITLVAILVALLIWLVTWLVMRDRAKKRENMVLSYTSAIEYIQDNNYIRAQEECKKALSFAEKLYDKKMRSELDSYLKFIEAVIVADDLYNGEAYSDAQEAYLNAKERARYADNIGIAYIDGRLENTRDFMAVSDLIYLGDLQFQNGDLRGAESKYLEAKNLATKVYFSNGKQQAIDALSQLYSQQAEQLEVDTEEAKAKFETELTAADMIKQADLAFANGDFESARIYYTIALEKYTELEDETRIQMLREKLAATENKKGDQDYKMLDAQTYERAAQDYYAAKKYVDAKKQYLFAKNLYAELKQDDKVKEIEQILEIIELDAEKPKSAPLKVGGSSKG